MQDPSRALVERITRSGERRHIVVLYSDLVDSTALASQSDPEEYRELLSAYHDLVRLAVEHFDGYVQQFQGDGGVCYFGYPIPSEQCMERAILAALRIVAGMCESIQPRRGPMEVRVGIAAGTVVVPPLLSPQMAAVGVAPSKAHRLQAMGGPSEVIVDEAGRRLGGEGFLYQDKGFHHLAGIADPVRVWRVLGPSPVRVRFDAFGSRGDIPMVGRTECLQSILKIGRASRNGQGAVVAISGEPGIGKSKLLRTVRESLAEEGVVALQFQCSPYLLNTAFGPLIDQVDAFLEGKYAPDETARMRLLRSGLETWHVPPDDRDLLCTVLSQNSGEAFGGGNMSPYRRKDETLRALVDLLSRWVSRTPTVVLIEDVQWIDPSSRELLGQIVARAPGIPLFLLVTHRPGVCFEWRSQPHVHGLELAPLGPAGSAELASRVAGPVALPAKWMETILYRADGVPLFLEQLTRSVVESLPIHAESGARSGSEPSPEFMIPETLKDSLMARIDRLFPFKEIAQIGAVIGREFDLALLSRLSGLTDQRLAMGLEQLVNAGMLSRRESLAGVTYLFRHALIQEVAYQSLLHVTRRNIHGQVARHLVERYPDLTQERPELIAVHFASAGLPLESATYRLTAADSAVKRMALDEAIAHVDHALDLLGDVSSSRARDELELAIRSVAGTAWIAARGWSAREVNVHLTRARELALNWDCYAYLPGILWGLWVSTLVDGRIRAALLYMQEAMDLGEARQDVSLQLVANLVATSTSFYLGRHEDVRTFSERTLALYDEDRHRGLSSVLNHDIRTGVGIFLSMALWMLGFPDQALKVCQEKDANARDLAHAFDICYALAQGASVYEYRGEPEMLLKQSTACIHLAEEQRLLFMQVWHGPIFEAVARIRMGEYAAGIDALARLDRHPFAVGIMRPYVYAVRGEALLQLDQPQAAMELVDMAIEQVERPDWGERVFLPEVLRVKGLILWRLGRLAAAQEAFAQSMDVAAEQRAKSWQLRTCLDLADLLRSQGRGSEIHGRLAEPYEWFTEGHGTLDLRRAMSILQQLEDESVE